MGSTPHHFIGNPDGLHGAPCQPHGRKRGQCGRIGGLAGRNGSLGGTSRPAGLRSSSTVSNSAPDTPSIAAWWIFVYTAARRRASPVIR